MMGHLLLIALVPPFPLASHLLRKYLIKLASISKQYFVIIEVVYLKRCGVNGQQEGTL
jgi:hypothetical protein